VDVHRVVTIFNKFSFDSYLLAGNSLDQTMHLMQTLGAVSGMDYYGFTNLEMTTETVALIFTPKRKVSI